MNLKIQMNSYAFTMFTPETKVNLQMYVGPGTHEKLVQLHHMVLHATIRTYA